MTKYRCLLVVFLYLILSVKTSFANSCREILKPFPVKSGGAQLLLNFSGIENLEGVSANSLLELDKVFLTRHESRKNNYALNRSLVRTLPRDQCAIGTCWLNSSLTYFEWQADAVFKEPVHLSDMFLLKKHFRNSAKAVFQRDKNSSSSGLGYSSSIFKALFLAREYGLVPEAFFEPRIDLRGDSLASKRFLAIFKLKVETLLQSQLPFLEKMSLVDAFLDEAIGRDPVEFDVQGTVFNPASFFGAVNSFVMNSRASLSPERAEAEIIQSLDDGRPVLIGLRWLWEFVDSKRGVATLSGFAAGFDSNIDVFKMMPKPINSHAILIVDYDLDEDGNLVKFLGQNTHGVQSGDEGFYHIYADYFYGAYTDHVLSHYNLPYRY